MSKEPSELYDRIVDILGDAIGDTAKADVLTAKLYELMDAQTQALLDIEEYAVEPGTDPMQAVIQIQRIAAQGLGRDGRDGFIPIYSTRPKD